MLALKVNNKVDITNDKNDELEVVISELERSLEVMEKNYRKAVTNLSLLRERVETDDLTHLLRRKAFLHKLQSLMDESKTGGQEVHLMMIDLDHFKNVNDTYGHQTGDDVLTRVSNLIRNYLRPMDIAGRFGGEEIIVAVQATYTEAVELAEGIRNAVASHRMTSVTNEKEFNITLSIGITSATRCEFNAQNMIADADAALYRAKHEGRDRVVVAL